jgi:hypothetical protein
MENHLKIIIESFLREDEEKWVLKYREIWRTEEMMYRRSKCHEFKSIWTQKGRYSFQICAHKAKIHALKKIVAYLKTISTKDPKQQGYIKNTIIVYNKMIKQMQGQVQQAEEVMEKEYGKQ